MPELPEVETTRRGISPLISGQTIHNASVRHAKLRWPVPPLDTILPGLVVHNVQRRAKYLLLDCGAGHLLIHLGMSGSLRVLPNNTPAQKHDHIDIQFAEHCLRLRDPRRFGAVLWTEDLPEQHRLISHLGPEPLSQAFNTEYFWGCAQQRKIAIKNLLMDGKAVVGVGNIYATEALFMAGIHPNRASNRISKMRLGALVEAVKHILQGAIKQGGTTLRDFQRIDGKPGYFHHQLQVYSRAGQACTQCGHIIKQMAIGQRNSSYCSHCQH